jgi:hypothetical protein
MKVTFDENGYVNGWCMIGDNGGMELEPPDDFDTFLDRFSGFKLEDGRLVFDKEKDDSDRLEEQRSDLRLRRETECFSYINRGYMWYSALTLLQWIELKRWYLAWLRVTETLTPPDKPPWIDSVDTTRIPDTPWKL